MADQHNDNVPAVGNSIAADIPDIKENLEWHKDLLQMILGWKADTIATVGPPNHRSKFRWKDADEIYIGPGSYFHDGTTRQTVFWDSELTFQLGSGGSNAGSDDIDAGAQAVHYIYLDDSAIVTQASPELDAGCFLNTDVTAPSWSDAKHGWYNGSDRCIFAVISDNSNNVLEFYHDGGDFVCYADHFNDVSGQDVDNTWEDIGTALSIPGFSTRANVSMLQAYGDVAGILYWRTNGQTAANGHEVLYGDADVTNVISVVDVITDTSQLIELKYGGSASTNTISVSTNGWYFPVGM